MSRTEARWRTAAAASGARSPRLRAISVAANGGFVVSSGVQVAVGQEGRRRTTRSPSWPTLSVVVPPSVRPSVRPRLQLQFRRPKNGRFKRNIFGETKEREGERGKGGFVRSFGGGKSDDFWPGASANESCGRARGRQTGRRTYVPPRTNTH